MAHRSLTAVGHGRFLDRNPARAYLFPMVRTPRDLAERMAARVDDRFARESFKLPRAQARAKAREFLDRYPAAAYMSAVESWCVLPGDQIEFTMKRLKSAD